MANQLFNKVSPSDMDKIRNCPSSVPSMVDRIHEAYDTQEEVILAIMAAGLPANCMELMPPHRNNVYDFKNVDNTINIGFKFVRSI